MNIKSLIKIYSNKYNFDYHKFPKNDLLAFQFFPKFNFIYNRLFISQIQNIKAFPTHILPDKFPVVIKPLINLKGMGLNSFLIQDISQFNKFKFSCHFWTTHLKGIHLSIDLIIRNGHIIYYTAFKGIKGKEFGTFNLWKEIPLILHNNKLLFKNINTLLSYLKDYTGNLNIETIGNYIIEAHLRMGDIDMKQQDILELILLNFFDKNDDIVFKQLHKVKNTFYKPIYLMPIWDDLLSKDLLIKKYKWLEQNIEPLILQDDKIISYYFDDVNHSSPFNKKRWFLLISEDLPHLYKTRKLYYKIISNF